MKLVLGEWHRTHWWQVNIGPGNGLLPDGTKQFHVNPNPQIRLFQTLTLKLKGQGHGCGQRARPYSQPSIWDTAILKFDLEKSKVKVMGEVKGRGHIVHPVSNRCTSFSFHINRTNHSWDMSNIVFDLEKTHLKFSNKIWQKTKFPT